MAFFTPYTYVPSKPVRARTTPSRFRLTYAFELRLYTAEGALMAGSNRVVNLPLAPTRYDLSSPLAHELTPTLRGVAAHEAGFVMQEITIEGTCGIATKTGWSPGAISGASIKGGGIFAGNGNTIWRELRNLFLIYSQLLDTGTHRPVMIWHDFDRDDHLVVVPTAWEVERTAEATRIHFPYRIKMTSVASADVGGVPGEASVVRLVESGVSAAVGAINLITAVALDAESLVNEATGVVRDSTIAVLGAVQSLGVAAQGIRDGVQDVLAVPWDVVRAWRSLVQTWRAALSLDDEFAAWDPTDESASVAVARYADAAAMEDAFDALLAQPDVFGEVLADAQARDANLERGDRLLTQEEIDATLAASQANPSITRGLTARVTPGSETRRQVEGDGPGPEPVYIGTRVYTVREGDTLQGIALREIGNTARWLDIAALNRLRAPYISPWSMPDTVSPGDTILIPVTVDARDVSRQRPQAQDDADRRLLGVDFYLNGAGAWEADPATSQDLRTIGGVPNFAQALERIKFRTELGQNPIWPQIGILAPIGQPNGAGVPEAVALSVRGVALGDRRTAEVTRLEVTDLGDGASVEIDIVPLGAQATQTLRAPAVAT